MPDPRVTVVLVHGAWHGPWCWQLLTPHLQAQGLGVQLVELPSVSSAVPAGLAQDAGHLTGALSRIEGPVVLCGHSYGGMVISAADTAAADVRQLVYLCAYLTEAGESVESSLLKAGERRPGHWIRRRPDGGTWVDAGRAATLFYNDCPPLTRNWAVARLRPHWGQAFSDPAAPAPGRRPGSTYVVCSEDRVLAPRIQRELYATRAERMVTLASGHAPFLSQPQQLARVLVCATL
jgi:pimeloyl-ACP methyl ester carboxylesterase